MAIKSFKGKQAERIFNGFFSKRLPQQIQRKARTRLVQLYAAVSVEDLRLPPSNHLEQLSGDRHGQYSIRINDQYRICFKWCDGSVVDVEIVDYH